MGYGGGKHDGGLLTDTIQIARIDPRLKEVILISVPRDLFVSLPTSVTATSGAKINAAFAFGSDDTAYPDKPNQFMGKNGGGAMAKYAVETVTGIPLDYYAAINFDSFTKTIDTLGGIDVNIRQTFTDPFYPLDGREKDTCGFSEDITKTIEATASGEKREQAYWCRFEPLTFTKGTVHLDGATALKYARSRHSPNNGGDFARSVRQKEVLEAVKTKMLSLGFLTKLIPFFQSISGNIQTDINAGTIQSALAIAGDIREYKINSIALTTDNVLKEDMTPEGQYILAPTDGIFNYKNIQKFITISIASISATSQTNK
jgi:anionic cell wall polymer biosynthesis LytR-Cps2A-Psr (LCP) family protein